LRRSLKTLSGKIHAMKKGVMITVAIAIAAALGFFAQRVTQPNPNPTAARSSAGTSNAPAAAAPATGTAAPAAPNASAESASATALKVPESLPAISLLDRDGKKKALADWAGRPLMVNYWATWCTPCRREIPLLNKLRKDYAKQNLEIVGIAVDFRDDVLQYAKETTIDYPLLIGEEEGLAAVTAMGMQPAFPFTVFTDKRHRVVTLKVGELHQNEADLILGQVTAIDAGTVELEAARTTITEGLKNLATQRAASGA
jgi:thiol-disulfide isomerase/thioredoxin